MNNLRKFATEAEYSAATLNYPAVSWVVSGDTLHYDLSGDTPTSVPAVKVAFTTDSCVDGYINLVTDGEMLDLINAITVNGNDVELDSSSISYTLNTNTDYLIEYFLKDNATDMGNYFNLTTPMGCASSKIEYDIYYPPQVTAISFAQYYVGSLLVDTDTPPTLYFDSSGGEPTYIYVPDSAVATYKADAKWSYMGNSIRPLSEYEGNIPLS